MTNLRKVLAIKSFRVTHQIHERYASFLVMSFSFRPSQILIESHLQRTIGSMNTCSANIDFDTVVVGGGSAGYAAARSLAAGGQKVAVVDGARELGGLCILRGCMPTKALLWAAEVRHLAHKSSIWGFKGVNLDFELSDVMKRKDEMIQEFAAYRQNQLQEGRFKLFRATASFRNSRSLQLSDGTVIGAKDIVLTTGSMVAPVPVHDLNTIGFLTSDSALRLARLPESIIVLGGGAIAIEFAQFFARFGVKTTILQRSETLLKEVDVDAAQAIKASFEDEGIEVITSTKLLGAHCSGNSKVIRFEKHGESHELSASEVFHGLGRVPAIKELNLGIAGVETRGGAIATNEHMQTSMRHIWAAGDCTGRHEVVHAAIHQGETIAHNILNPTGLRSVDDRLLMNVVFSDPQVATLGLTEKAAKAAGIPIISASYSFNDHGKSMIMGVRHGFVKVIAHPQTGEILGACCVGPQAGDLIHEMTVAMAKRMTVREFAAVPHYHPTLAEIWTYPSEELVERLPS